MLTRTHARDPEYRVGSSGGRDAERGFERILMTRAFLENIHIIDCAFVRGALHLRLVDEESGRNHLQVFRGEVVPSGPLRFVRMMGSKPYDFLSTSLVSLVVVSNRVIELFRENGFTGWGTYPVLVRGKNGAEVDGYHGLIVSGHCGPIDRSMSERVWRDPRSPGGRPTEQWLGLYFRPESWDGSDIFSPAGTSFIFVVQKVRDALARAGLRNFGSKRATEHEMHIIP